MERQVRRWRLDGKVDAFEINSTSEAGVLHCHPSFNIGAMIEGAASVTSGSMTHVQAPGAVVTLNAYQPHASAWSAAVNRYFVLHIDPAFWETRLQPELGADGQFAQPVCRDGLVFHYLLGLRDQLHKDPTSVSSDDIDLLLKLCRGRGLIRDHVDEEDPSLTPMNGADFRELFSEGDDMQEGQPRISNLAEQVGMSRYQFSRLCSQTAGMQPRRLRLQLMVARAQKAINEGQDLASASLHAGFSDQSHMNREFRRTIGMTPREYQSAGRI